MLRRLFVYYITDLYGKKDFSGSRYSCGNLLERADIEEHVIPDAPKAYGLNKVFQVVGHSRLNDEYDKVEFANLVLIDSQQCFMIVEDIEEKIVSVRNYEKYNGKIK